jgi:hypothetical protein
MDSKFCAAEAQLFQSTLPSWVATGSTKGTSNLTKVSIHATHEGGDFIAYKAYRFLCVSIHATRVGGDVAGWPETLYAVEVSIHASPAKRHRASPN